MPIFTEHASGMPCWIDSSVATTAERLALIDFYSALFNWQFDVGTAEMGFYSIARSNGAEIIFPPIQIMNFGWMSLIMDPSQAVYGLWQPIDFYQAVLGVGSQNEGERKILTNGDQWFASVSHGEEYEHTSQWMPVFSNAASF